jgi:hypothetical protein
MGYLQQSNIARYVVGSDSGGGGACLHMFSFRHFVNIMDECKRLRSVIRDDDDEVRPEQLHTDCSREWINMVW